MGLLGGDGGSGGEGEGQAKDRTAKVRRRRLGGEGCKSLNEKD